MHEVLLKLETELAGIRVTPPGELDERTEELRQEYETVLCLLETEFLAALTSGNWSEFDEFVAMFKSENKNQ